MMTLALSACVTVIKIIIFYAETNFGSLVVSNPLGSEVENYSVGTFSKMCFDEEAFLTNN